jgi:hypothetical protein
MSKHVVAPVCSQLSAVSKIQDNSTMGLVAAMAAVTMTMILERQQAESGKE